MFNYHFFKSFSFSFTMFSSWVAYFSCIVTSYFSIILYLSSGMTFLYFFKPSLESVLTLLSLSLLVSAVFFSFSSIFSFIYFIEFGSWVTKIVLSTFVTWKPKSHICTPFWIAYKLSWSNGFKTQVLELFGATSASWWRGRLLCPIFI